MIDSEQEYQILKLSMPCNINVWLTAGACAECWHKIRWWVHKTLGSGLAGPVEVDNYLFVDKLGVRGTQLNTQHTHTHARARAHHHHQTNTSPPPYGYVWYQFSDWRSEIFSVLSCWHPIPTQCRILQRLSPLNLQNQSISNLSCPGCKWTLTVKA